MRAYLRRLGLSDLGSPSVSGLRALHAAHVERVPYELLESQLGGLTSIEPSDSVARIVDAGRGGYCYHLNGAFSVLLQSLGYDVVWHRAGVQRLGETSAPGPSRANHLALTVHGLPAPESPDGSWLVDVGLGDALHEPLPLREGSYVQGPLRFGLRRSSVAPGGWRFDHDPRGSFPGMDFGPTRATVADFQERHVQLSTDPSSEYVRTCTVQRRDASGVDILTGCLLKRLDGAPCAPRVLETQSEWFQALADVFGLPLPDLDAAARTRLWTRLVTAHESWLHTHTP